jgi:hypothetical protein
VTVAPDELTGTEQAVLLVLMAEARPVPNPELATLGPELKKRDREHLQRLGLIDVRAGRPLQLDLTDKGWAVCKSLIGAGTPDRSTGQGRALYTLLRSLRRYLDDSELAPADVFSPAADTPDMESRVRRTYEKLASRPGGWVGLVRLRGELADVPRGDLDAVLTDLYRQPGVSLIPEENQKTLTEDDRAAAVRIGGQHKHLIAIES